MRELWPPGEAAQADYEALREAALAGAGLASPAATRFARAGLAGLIARPSAPAVFVASLAGAVRPAWTPYEDPRMLALADGYELLLVRAEGVVGSARPASAAGQGAE